MIRVTAVGETVGLRLLLERSIGNSWGPEPCLCDMGAECAGACKAAGTTAGMSWAPEPEVRVGDVTICGGVEPFDGGEVVSEALGELPT